MNKKVRLIVGSPSEYKLSAVREACLELGLNYEVTGLEVDSEQNEQPVGLSETTAGALTRAEKAQKKDFDAIAIGIESGIIRTGGPHFVSIDLAVIVAIFEDDIIITTSNGMQFVEEFVEIAQERGFKHTTVGAVIAEFLGGNKNDPHSLVSDGTVSRKETIKNGVKIVMNQAVKKWLNH